MPHIAGQSHDNLVIDSTQNERIIFTENMLERVEVRLSLCLRYSDFERGVFCRD